MALNLEELDRIAADPNNEFDDAGAALDFILMTCETEGLSFVLSYDASRRMYTVEVGLHSYAVDGEQKRYFSAVGAIRDALRLLRDLARDQVSDGNGE